MILSVLLMQIFIYERNEDKDFFLVLEIWFVLVFYFLIMDQGSFGATFSRKGEIIFWKPHKVSLKQLNKDSHCKIKEKVNSNHPSGSSHPLAPQKGMHWGAWHKIICNSIILKCLVYYIEVLLSHDDDHLIWCICSLRGLAILNFLVMQWWLRVQSP